MSLLLSFSFPSRLTFSIVAIPLSSASFPVSHSSGPQDLRCLSVLNFPRRVLGTPPDLRLVLVAARRSARVQVRVGVACGSLMQVKAINYDEMKPRPRGCPQPLDSVAKSIPPPPPFFALPFPRPVFFLLISSFTSSYLLPSSSFASILPPVFPFYSFLFPLNANHFL